ncbi:MAG TPA: haloacid dehalogenase-like hydrolase [Candidatus Hydrogenedens sp.]|nr:haloacid dehalogenase-like hydrolase [Candidatus Hydrogenedens sp.]HOL18694.1 haloacid dehalogenase-like hydrolase [Candidatus Hydrogenedens sp.]HPP58509.1 haloacid dehalogenase-like hydrolase [Candidatus Hydrogenedens sp.]
MDSGKSLPFSQNVIAIVWDFDFTLTPKNMQEPLFIEYGVDEQTFWKEVNALPEYYKKAGIRVSEETAYLWHIISYVKAGTFPDLTNQKLRELGGKIPFFPGLPEFFLEIQQKLNREPYLEYDLKVEHYIVSSGLAEMIKGSKIAPYISGVWASEFIEVPAGPGEDFTQQPKSGLISQVGYIIDHTTKTRALFEINKGINKVEGIRVNDSIPENARRVPFKNMIYVGDGPSDIPCFSVVRKHGGLTYAVYPRGDEYKYQQVIELLESDRIDAYGPADYREDSETVIWLKNKVIGIANRIVEEKKSALYSQIKSGPKHTS